jgi:hypothetical protein
MGKRANALLWHLINSLLIGFISFVSSMLAFISDSGFNSDKLYPAAIIALATALLVGAYKFKDWFDTTEGDYSRMFDLL